MANESDVNQILATVARLEGELRTLKAQLTRLHPAERTGGVLVPSELQEAPTPLPSPVPAPAPQVRPAAAAPRPARPAAPPKPQRPPLQASTLLAIAGAALFLLGVVFFLWLSIQRGWINPTARVLLGLVTSGGLLALAAKFLPGERRAVAVALLAAGLGTLDFSAFAGFSLYHLYPAGLGLGLAVAGALVAGGLGTRAQSQAALAVGLLAALLAPPLFSTGGHHEVSLALYLAGLMGALLLVPYRTATGARWGFVRWLAVIGVWGLLATSLDAPVADAPALLALLALHLGLALAWVWLPGAAGEVPSSPLSLWALALMAFASLLWGQWRATAWPQAAFAGPIVLLGALNLGLVKPLRARLGSRKADFGLLAFGAAFLALALPIALDWAWVGPLWGVFALSLAYASGAVEAREDSARWAPEEVAHLRRLALGLTILATLRWFFAVDHLFGPERTPFVNGAFALGATAAAAWLLLARRGGALGVIGFVAGQALAHLALAAEVESLARSLGASYRGASVAITVALAASGALHWLASLRAEAGPLRRGLTAAGYLWLAFASIKLIGVDLAQADLAARALAFLAVGGIFLATALVGARARAAKEA